MESKIKSLIEHYNLIETGELVVVGVSGGPDSVALLHVLSELSTRYGFNLHIAHLNHGFRGGTATEDARFVENLAKDLRLPVTSEAWDVKSYVKRHRLTPQEGAREQRYDFFLKIAREQGASKIALAHHKDDQVETFLFRLIRGAGLEGLSGMPVIRELDQGIHIIRPLLQVSKKEILNYLTRRELTYRLDHTNEESVYMRNKIRNCLIPEMEKLNPQVCDQIFETTQTLQAEHQYLDALAEKEFDNALVEPVGNQVTLPTYDELCLELQTLQALSVPLLTRVLLKSLRSTYKNRVHQENINKNHLKNLADLVRYNGGTRVNLPGNFWGYLDKRRCGEGMEGVLVLSLNPPVAPPDMAVTLNVPGVTYWPLTNQQILSNVILVEDMAEPSLRDGSFRAADSTAAYLDYNKIQWPVVIRNRRAGDRFMPLGMSGFKKLKDFFIDNKIPKYERSQKPLLVSGTDILWVAGHQIDERYKVTQDTDEVLYLKISYKEKGEPHD